MTKIQKRESFSINSKIMKNRSEFPVTEVCSTGLSGGAIAGIVIGCLAGVALIGVAIYFLACNKKDDDKGKYEVTQVSFTQECFLDRIPMEHVD